MRGCAVRIARRGRQAVGDRIGADDEILVGVERLAGADQEVEPVVIARDRRHHQDGVGLLVVERAVGDVGDRKVPDRLAAFQLEVAFAVALVRRLLRGVRCGRQRHQQCGGDDVSDTFHFVFSPGARKLCAASERPDALVHKTLFEFEIFPNSAFCTDRKPGQLRACRDDKKLVARANPLVGLGRHSPAQDEIGGIGRVSAAAGLLLPAGIGNGA